MYCSCVACHSCHLLFHFYYLYQWLLLQGNCLCGLVLVQPAVPSVFKTISHASSVMLGEVCMLDSLSSCTKTMASQSSVATNLQFVESADLTV